MIIYYPTYYLVPVTPIISLDHYEYDVPFNDEYRFRYDMEGNKAYTPCRNINEDRFYEVDEEYVNDPFPYTYPLQR